MMLDNFTHIIDLKDDTEYEIDPRFGEDEYVDSLNFFKENINNFKTSFITYFQVDEPSYSLNFVKYDGQNLFHAEVDYLDDFSGLEDESDEYYNFMNDLDKGYLDIKLLDGNSWVNWKKLTLKIN